MGNITLTDIKKNNYSLIYNLLYEQEKLSKQEIANQLHLSLPTVTQNLVALEEAGLIEKGGQFESQVGRRAVAYTVCPQAGIGVGVEILKKQVRILAVDLKGQICGCVEHKLLYRNDDAYYKETADFVSAFIRDSGFGEGQVLGIGFAVQGLTTADGQEIIFGKTLGYTGLKITALSGHLKYPCMFLHDAKCAAATELWNRRDLTDAIYLSIGKHLGGAVIIGGQTVMGKQNHGGAVEHMTLIPGGRPCYCGKSGCMETYCSVNALIHEEETLEEFFTGLRDGEEEKKRRFDDYLDHLSTAVNNLHMVMDCDVILGGHMAPYLTRADMDILHEKVWEKSAFPDEEDFIFLSETARDSVPVGAALEFVRGFLDGI
nr:ROK family transcriptional regulator [uncultured Blautia sp.]